MALRPEERKVIIEDLVMNCDCWKGNGDKELLASFNDDKLVGLKTYWEQQRQAVEVANVAVRGFDDGKNAYRINPQTGKWEQKVVEPVVNKGTTTEGDNQSGEPPAPTPQSRGGSPPPRSKKQTSNARTEVDWMKDIPPEAQAKFAYLQQIEQREKNKIIDKLLINVADGEKRAHAERLQRRTLEDLMNDLALVPTINSAEEPRQRRSSGTLVNRQQGHIQVDDDMLNLPDMWKEVGDKSQSQTTTVANSGSGSASGSQNIAQDEDEEEWFQKAPAHLRARVINAMQIEDRERRKIIEELISNYQGEEEQESRLIQRFQVMSLDTLKDMLALLPRKPQNQANYFGAAVPMSNAARQTANNDVNEDVLPLPKFDWNEVRKQG